MTLRNESFVWALLAAIVGCSSQAEESGEVTLEIEFEAVVGGAVFGCEEDFEVGTPAARWRPTDLRMYVSEFVAISSDGTEKPLGLVADDDWQSDSVALLDFEDGTEGCSNGTSRVNHRVTVSGPGTFEGLGFTLGVPFEDNHQESAAAPAPLNVSALFWNWQGGYKFLRADAEVESTTGFSVHLGSTGCDGSAAGGVTTCLAPNRPEIRLRRFDPSTEVVRFDLGALLSGSDVTRNTQDTAPGCMSSPTDPDCDPIFERLGLPRDGSAVDEQTVFDVSDR